MSPLAKLSTGIARAIAGFVLLVVGGAQCGCGPSVNPAAVPSDVMNIDIALCQLDKDLGGPSVPLLCPFGRITMPRAQYLAAKAASVDGGGQ